MAEDEEGGDGGTGDDRTFSLFNKDNNQTKGSGEEAKSSEQEQNLKRSTLTDYLPNIFGRRKNNNSAEEESKDKAKAEDESTKEATKDSNQAAAASDQMSKRNEMASKFGPRQDHFRPLG